MIVQVSNLSRSLCRASALEGVDNSSQFSVFGKLMECSIESCAQVFNEDGEEHKTFKMRVLVQGSRVEDNWSQEALLCGRFCS